jgi:hypothetical protein
MIRLQNIDSNIKPSRTFGRGKYLIGRSPSCDLEIPDRTMSRQHAMLEVVDDERIYLTDLDSRNGTKVNGERIMNTVRLKPEDIVSFGDVSFSVSPVDDDTFRGDTVPVGGSGGPDATVEIGVDTNEIPIVAGKESLVDALEYLGRILVDPQEEDRVYTDLLKGARLAVNCKEISLHLLGASGDKVERSFSLSEGRLRTVSDVPLPDTAVESVVNSAPIIRVSGNPNQQSGDNNDLFLAARLESDGRVVGLISLKREDNSQRDPAEIFEDIDDRTISAIVHVISSKIANLLLLQERS